MMGEREAVRVRAFAKINLRLRVGERRADGYHPLETVFQSLALHDTVVCAEGPGPFALVCDDDGVPADERNLAWKAAAALWHALGRRGAPVHCRVTIAKRIPMQAGLGGGSADAAAALAALHALWRGRLPADELVSLAASIGADVPYFLVGGTALGLGRGDEVYPLPDIARRWVVLACPPFGVPTASAYGWLDGDRASGAATCGEPASRLRLWDGPSVAVLNDLEAPVVRRHPEIGRLVEVLREGGAEAAAMSGSGSAVFGLFGSEARARRAAHRAAAVGALVVLTRTAARGWCRRALGRGAARG